MAPTLVYAATKMALIMTASVLSIPVITTREEPINDFSPLIGFLRE